MTFWEEFITGFKKGLNKPNDVPLWQHVKNEFWKGYNRGYLNGYIWGSNKREQIDHNMEIFRSIFHKNWRP